MIITLFIGIYPSQFMNHKFTVTNIGHYEYCKNGIYINIIILLIVMLWWTVVFKLNFHLFGQISLSYLQMNFSFQLMIDLVIRFNFSKLFMKITAITINHRDKTQKGIAAF